MSVPVLEPADPTECKEFMKLAFDMSEKYDTVVLMRSGTRMSHSRGIVEEGERVEREIILPRRDIRIQKRSLSSIMNMEKTHGKDI